MDATDSELVARYKKHVVATPLAADGRAFRWDYPERELLAPLENISQNVVDTTELTPRNLRKTIAEQFASQDNQPDFRVEVMSFGFNTAFRSMLTSSLMCVFFQIPTINWNFGI